MATMALPLSVSLTDGSDHNKLQQFLERFQTGDLEEAPGGDVFN
jgi:hypothetical protein